jgi:Fis family transcriptional regulator, factor for inversion stimulation protein
MMQDQLGTLVAQMHHGGILYSEAVREFKRMFIATVLRANKGNQIQTARELRMHRNTVRRLMAELEVDTSFRRQPARRPPKSESSARAAKANRQT